jgi:hypothetical protein
MNENNNSSRTLSDVALERVMRDVLGLWEPSPNRGEQQPEAVCPHPEHPDEDAKPTY